MKDILEGKIVLFNTLTKERKLFQFPPLDECFPNLKQKKVKSRKTYFLFPSEFVDLSNLKKHTLGKITEDIFLEDSCKFKRFMQVRFDGTHHDNTGLHLNVDATTTYLSPNGKKVNQEEHKQRLGKFHFVDVGQYAYAIYIQLIWPGKAIHQPILILPSEYHVNYYKEEKRYMDKFNKGNVSIEDKEKYLKLFNDYANYIKKH